MRLLGLLMLVVGLGGGGALVALGWRRWNPDAVRARREREALERARALAEENELLDRIINPRRREEDV